MLKGLNKAYPFPQTGTSRHVFMFAVVAALLMMLLSVLMWPLPSRRHTPSGTEEEALAFFTKNQLRFDELRALLEKQNTLVFYHYLRNEATPPDAFAGVPGIKQRIDSLMSELNLEMVNGPASSWGLRMPYILTGMATGGTTRSFYFSRKRPARLVPSIDNFRIDKNEGGSVWREICSNWYLEYDWDG